MESERKDTVAHFGCVAAVLQLRVFIFHDKYFWQSLCPSFHSFRVPTSVVQPFRSWAGVRKRCIAADVTLYGSSRIE